jgi:glucosamine-phosphate N-acetyltransferase
MEINISFNGLTIRNLQKDDFSKGLSDLIGYDRDVESSYEAFESRIQDCGNFVHLVAEDSGLIVANGLVVIEKKFIRGGGSVGHLEGLFVSSLYRNRGIATKIVETLLDVCKNKGCYKVILSSSHDLQSFFERLGFSNRGLNMGIDLAESNH